MILWTLTKKRVNINIEFILLESHAFFIVFSTYSVIYCIRIFDAVTYITMHVVSKKIKINSEYLEGISLYS